MATVFLKKMRFLMEKHRKKFSIRLIEKIGHDEEEREIIQYGLHQGFLILLNLFRYVNKF